MGLREAKKQKVRFVVIENAIALFRERGFEATKVREIAKAAEISEATFFNYFPTKDAVLSDWAHAGVIELLERASEGGDRGVRPVMRAVCVDLAARIEVDRAFAARAWERARLTAPGPPGALIALLEAGQSGGQLRRDLSSRQLGEILYAAIVRTIASWLERAAPAGSLAPELRRSVDLVLDGARRRNERVRPGASAAAGAGSAAAGAGTGATGTIAPSPPSTR